MLARRFFAILVVSVFALPVFAGDMAQDTAKDTAKDTARDMNTVPKWFQAIDANHDRIITLSEMHAARFQRFARADQDRDGLLTPVELRTDRSWLSRFATFDQDRNGRISIAEFEQRGLTRFMALDINGDGHVSLREAIEVIKAQVSAMVRKTG